MPMNAREMIKLLKENGFVDVSQNGSHKKLFNPETKETIIIPVHGSTELKKGLEQKILKQAGLK